MPGSSRALLGQCRGRPSVRESGRARNTGAMAHPEHERWSWEADGREPFAGEPLALVINGERAIEPFLDLDACAGIAAAARSGEELHDVFLKAHRVVLRDGARVLETAQGIEDRGGRSRAKGRSRVRGRLREAAIEARQKRGQDPLRLGKGRRLGQAEFLHEAILQGAKEPLDPTLGFRGGRGDPADT